MRPRIAEVGYSPISSEKYRQSRGAATSTNMMLVCAVFAIELNGRMLDAEVLAQALGDGRDDVARRRARRAADMQRHHGPLGGQRPGMDMVHFLHGVDAGFEIGAE